MRQVCTKVTAACGGLPRTCVPARRTAGSQLWSAALVLAVLLPFDRLHGLPLPVWLPAQAGIGPKGLYCPLPTRAAEMVKKYSGPRLPVLMDNGTADDYLQTQVTTACSGGPGGGSPPSTPAQLPARALMPARHNAVVHTALILCTLPPAHLPLPLSFTPGRSRGPHKGSWT